MQLVELMAPAVGAVLVAGLGGIASVFSLRTRAAPPAPAGEPEPRREPPTPRVDLEALYRALGEIAGGQLAVEQRIGAGQLQMQEAFAQIDARLDALAATVERLREDVALSSDIAAASRRELMTRLEDVELNLMAVKP